MKYRYTISIHNFRYKKDNQIQQTINSLEHSVVGASLEQGAGEGRAGHSRVREVGPWSEGLGKSGSEADRITPFPPPRPPGQLWYLLGRPVQKPISSVCQAVGGWGGRAAAAERSCFFSNSCCSFRSLVAEAGYCM